MSDSPLQTANKCAKISDSIADASPLSSKQLIKFMRRVMALTDGRHEIILTVRDGVQDWTVRAIGKVEN